MCTSTDILALNNNHVIDPSSKSLQYDEYGESSSSSTTTTSTKTITTSTDDCTITPDEFSKAVSQKRYADVQHMLSPKNDSPIDPNVEITFLGGMYMTSLEFSVFQGDWEMSLLLFLNGADPMLNCFDGTMKSYTSAFEVKAMHDSFKKRKCIPGFGGLRALINTNGGDSSKVMQVCLWLMELVYDSSVDLDATNHTTIIMECIMTLIQDLAKTHQDKQEILCDIADYIQRCCEGIMNGREYGIDSKVLDNELFEVSMFSLRIIVQRVISLHNDNTIDDMSI